MEKTESENTLGSKMRAGMRRFASGIAVLTAVDEKGEMRAMTASSLTSVSDAPPSVLVSVNKGAKIHETIKSTGVLAINILTEVHQEVSNRCSSSDQSVSRFDVGDWALDDESGIAVLADAAAVFICELRQSLVHGTHEIFVCDIVRAKVSDKTQAALVYMDGGYHTLN